MQAIKTHHDHMNKTSRRDHSKTGKALTPLAKSNP